jgi:hypothetical protein
VRSFCQGVKTERFVLLFDLGNQVLLAINRGKKGENGPFIFSLRRDDEVERAVTAIKSLDFAGNILKAHMSVGALVEMLMSGAEEHFVNRGLFSNYFLKDRMTKTLFDRGRRVEKECSALLERLGGEVPCDPEKVLKVLEALGFFTEQVANIGYPEYSLRKRGSLLDVVCVAATVDSLDVKTGELVTPSYQAVSALGRYTWVILTNGRLWRLYSSRVASASTNYFEVNVEGLSSESDHRLAFFISLFSALAFASPDEVGDVDVVFEGGLEYAQKVEDDLRSKVFSRQLFLDLVRGVIEHSPKKVYTKQSLNHGKDLALKLLYRLLFILYAESRGLLPVSYEAYSEMSLSSLRTRLGAFEKQPKETTVWEYLKRLFRTIGEGSVENNVPQYDGALFAFDADLEKAQIRNVHLVNALRDLMDYEGRGIDYQNLGVRHLGSLYEALLEYSVIQATEPLIVYREEILPAKFAEDLKQKPESYIEEGDLFLSVKGLQRKGTGSYYTPDELVAFLVRNGLDPQLKARAEKFKADLSLLKEKKYDDTELLEKCNDDLLGIKVVDPAMGSGHFLVAAVDVITQWAIELLNQNPDAPLLNQIEENRKTILEEQREKGIQLDETLLTDTVVLKRMVMKRCVYGVDVNPLAVELAKVSLWLDSFTIGAPLTYLDHHIRCGDSLIGMWLENAVGSASYLDKWFDNVSAAGKSLSTLVSMPADLTLEEAESSRRAYSGVRERTQPQKVYLDMVSAGFVDEDLGKRLPRNRALVEKAVVSGTMPSQWKEAEKLADRMKFFHWEVEFPDAFNGPSRGFDLVIMNPPWEAVKSEDDDFFSVHDPHFRKLTSVQKKTEEKNKLLKISDISDSYKEYNKRIEEKVSFFKESGQYVQKGGGDIDLWKLFLERALVLVSAYGTMSVLVPSALVTNEGAKELRETLFKNRIRAMFEFENARGIFSDVHRSYKFVLLIVDKAKPLNSFPAAFYLHDIKALVSGNEKEKFLEMPSNIGNLCSPNSLSIPEVRSKKYLDILIKIYQSHPLLGDEKGGWNVALIREIGASPSDSKIFRSDGKGWILIEGKCFHQFLPDFEKIRVTIDPVLGLKHTAKHKIFQGINKEIHEEVKLIYRHVGRSTDVRSLIACIVPPCSFCYQSAVIVVPKRKGITSRSIEYYRDIAYLAGIMNSFVFDFLIRQRFNINLTFFMIYQTPIPKTYSKIADEIIKHTARLSSIDSRFKKFASTLEVEVGPLNMKDRVELISKINALVAKQYGLNREDLLVILQSFNGFEENPEIMKLEEPSWNSALIRSFNGEVRKGVLKYFDDLKEAA